MSDDPTLTLAAAASEYAKAFVAERETWARYEANRANSDHRDWLDAWGVRTARGDALCRAALVANGVKP